MTDNEIVKGLECCVTKEDCDGCPYDEINDCIKGHEEDILDLIKRQKAENERLKTNLNIELENYATEYDNKIKAEAYREFAERVKLLNQNNLILWNEQIDNILKELVGDDE